MRVVQVNKFHFVKGGAERYYLDLSAALARRGLVVNHLAMDHPRNLAASPGDRFVRHVDYRERAGWLERSRQGMRSIYNREAAARARELAASGERPVAHLHNVYHQLSPSVIRAFAKAGVPVVQTLHDYKLVCPAYLLLTEGRICERCRGGRFHEAVRHRCLLDSRGASLVAAIEAYVHSWLRTYARVRRFLCPSRFLLEKVASFGIPRERLAHLPYFLPLEQYRAAPVPPRGAGDPAVGAYVGRLSREKGIAVLLEAAALLPPGRLRLDVLGEGPLRAELEARARAVCPDGRVRFLGYRSGEELHETVRRASFALVPSEWFENLPYSVLEPFALGRPVVGARIGGIPELVQDGETGRLHEPGDVPSLAEALLWMSGPAADLKSMGWRARQVIERDHAEGPHLDRLLAVYREVAA
jgi:glycosyltransferase involved in cell wall biosynthesis